MSLIQKDNGVVDITKLLQWHLITGMLEAV